MKSVASLAAIIVVLLSCNLALADEKASDNAIKWNFDFFEKTWGIKLKSGSVKDTDSGLVVTMTLEFTKDLDNVDDARLFFSAPKNKNSNRVMYILFDGDGVPITHNYLRGNIKAGLLTGKQGDAFVIELPFGNTKASQVKKVEARADKPLPKKP